MDRRPIAGIAAVALVAAGAVGARNIGNEPSGGSVRGTLLVQAATPLPGRTTPPIPQVFVKQGDEIKPTGIAPSDDVVALAGQSVKIDGTNVEPTTARVEQASLQSQMKIAVVFLRPQGLAQVPQFTIASAQANFFGATNSVTEWYRQTSGGQVTVTGQLFTAPPCGTTNPPGCANDGFFVSGSTDPCDLGTQQSQAKSLAGVDASFTNVVVVGPGASCPFAGIAYVGWPGVFLNGYVGQSVAEHELGHNLGIWHAGSINATGGQYDYGDSSDTMGSGNNREFSSWHKWKLGWLTAANVRDVTTTGATTVDIGNDESPIAGTEMVRVGNYAIDRRSSVGYDAGLSGVWVRKIGQSGTSDTVIPLMPSGPVKALLPGQTFAGDGGVTITTLADDPASPTASVRVCLGPCSTPPPSTTTTTLSGTTTTTSGGPGTTVPPTTSTTLPPGGTFGYETGDDSDGTAAYASFRLAQTFTPPAGLTATQADLRAARRGNVGVGTCTILATNAAGLPTGPALARGTTGATLTAAAEWRPCVLSAPVVLQAGTLYALVVSWSGGNGNNGLYWRGDQSAPTYEGGMALRSRSSGAWDATSPIPGRDNLFRIRG